MSFFDDASLAFLPSGAAGKDGKAYSIKPTDGTGDFTFSRGSNLAATRVGADGLIEKGRENLFLQSNQFDTTWVLTDSISLTSGQTGYDGSSDAWKLENTLSAKYLYQSIAVTGVQTFSFYAKSGTLDWAFILINSTNVPRVYFDLQNGLVGSELGSVIDSKIESVDATGWYRISITFNETISQVRIYPAAADNDINGTGSIYIQDAQLEIGLAATDVISTGATTGKAGLLEDEPRFDYSGGATCPSLLLEGSRTNRCTLSEYFEGAAWLSVGSPTITTNYGISPEGVKNSTRIVFSAANQCIYDGIAYTSEEVSTIYVKGTSGETIKFGKGDNIFVGTLFTLDGTWQRLEFVQSVSGNTFTINTSGGATARDIEIWGAQNEEGSYPTSYIPNHSGGSVTRGADSCTDAGDATTFNSAEGVLYFEVAGFENDLSDRYISISDGTSNNAIRVFYYQDSATTFFRKNVNGVQTTIFSTGDINKSELNKIAIKYNSTNFDIFSNGVKLSTNLDSNSFPINTLSEVNFANADGVANSFNGKVNQLLTFNTALSDADCITLTTL